MCRLIDESAWKPIAHQAQNVSPHLEQQYSLSGRNRFHRFFTYSMCNATVRMPAILECDSYYQIRVRCLNIGIKKRSYPKTPVQNPNLCPSISQYSQYPSMIFMIMIAMQITIPAMALSTQIGTPSADTLCCTCVLGKGTG